MQPPPASPTLRVLSFQPLRPRDRGHAFPCDSRGAVDLDRLSDAARNDYLFARAMVGRAYAPPVVEAAPGA